MKKTQRNSVDFMSCHVKCWNNFIKLKIPISIFMFHRGDLEIQNFSFVLFFAYSPGLNGFFHDNDSSVNLQFLPLSPSLALV